MDLAKSNSSNEIMSGNDEEDLLDNLISRVQKEKKNDDDHDDPEDNF